MSILQFDIKSYDAAGSIALGMPVHEARETLNKSFRSFKRGGVEPCDYFPDLGVFIYITPSQTVAAVEFSTPAEPTLDGVNLLGMKFGALREFLRTRDDGLEIEDSTLTSQKLGVGAYSGEGNDRAEVDSVIVFSRGYFS